MLRPSPTLQHDSRADTLRLVASERARDGHFAAAASLLARALELAERAGDRRGAADACFDSAVVHDEAGDLGTARYYAEQARTLYVVLHDWAKVSGLLEMLGRLPIPTAVAA
jgi:hypothetical protein